MRKWWQLKFKFFSPQTTGRPKKRCPRAEWPQHTGHQFAASGLRHEAFPFTPAPALLSSLYLHLAVLLFFLSFHPFCPSLSGAATHQLVISLVVLAERVEPTRAGDARYRTLASRFQCSSAGRREMCPLGCRGQGHPHRVGSNKMAAREEEKGLLQSGSRWLQAFPRFSWGG